MYKGQDEELVVGGGTLLGAASLTSTPVLGSQTVFTLWLNGCFLFLRVVGGIMSATAREADQSRIF